MPFFVVLIISLIILLIIFIAIRTVIFVKTAENKPLPFSLEILEPEINPQITAEHLAKVIRIETITHEDPAEDKPERFNELHRMLEKMYPLAHKAMKRELIDGFSLLYIWAGKDPALEPVAFMAHQDVVPADENTLDEWKYPPFSGQIAEGYIWGRGTLDIKSQLISVFEAVESLLKANYQPERTVMLAFGHNEEVLGTGAKAIVAHLKSRGVRLQAVIDEGGTIYDGIIPGVKGLVTAIGVAEKGYLSLKFTVKTSGGHSSTPQHETAIGILARGIDRLQSNPFPNKVQAVLPMFHGLSPFASRLMQVAFANLWLFGGYITRLLAADSETAATIHTTTAPTIFHSGVKDNVLPSLAEAIVNFRVLPGESIQQVSDKVKEIINDDRISFEAVRGNAWEATPVSPTDSPAYRHIATTAAELFPGVVNAPYVMLGATDARNYYDVSSQVYRFSPYLMRKEDLDTVHGINEKLSVEGLEKMVRFFHRLIQRWGSTEM